jgi:uncharacterized protein
MRVIIDSNVAIAAVASRGLCEALMELCLEHHEIILCEGILKEIREKLIKKIRVSPSAADEFIKVLRGNSQILKPETVVSGICRDPNDEMILGLVIPAKADIIVSGDKDLLVLKKYNGVNIVTPRQFWDENRKGN